MKIIRENLMKALTIAKKITSKAGNNLTVLHHVLIDGPGQCLIANNLEMAMIYPLSINDWQQDQQAIEREKTAGEMAAINFDANVTLKGMKKDQLQAYAVENNITLPKEAKSLPTIKAAIADFYAQIIANLPAPEMIVSKGQALISVDTLYDIVKTLSSEEVVITPCNMTPTGEILEVSINDHFMGIKTMPVEEFPEVKELKENVQKTVISKANLEKTFCATTANTNEGFDLNGIKFDPVRNCAVTTDGHRLHKATATKVEKSWLLPLTSGKILASLVKDTDELSFEVNDVNAYIALGDARFIVRTMEERFPDYGNILSENTGIANTVVVTKESVDMALKQAMIMTDKDYHSAVITFNGGMDIQLRNPILGTYQRAQIPVESGHIEPPVQLGMNLRYVIDAINATKEKTAKISLKFDGPSSPLFIEHTGFTGLVMPVRVD